MRVKEMSQNQQEKDFELNLSFEEWLDYYNKEPNCKELNVMEKHLNKPYSKIYPYNNPNYQPKQGA